MSRTWTIARRELASFFDSLIAFILLVVFLGVSGIFTWMLGSDVFLRGQADLQAFFGIAYWALYLFVPALTMRTLAEERRSGTLDLLLSRSVSDWQVVLGKFWASLLLIAIALACTLPYYLTVAWLGDLDHGAAWSGYLALFLLGAAYVSIGVYASSITDNQIVAFLVALTINTCLHLLLPFIAGNFTGVAGSVLEFLGTPQHFQSMGRGVVDSRDLLYFLSVVVLGLTAAEINLAKRGLKGS